MFKNRIFAYVGYLIFFASYVLYILSLSNILFALEGDNQAASAVFADYRYNFVDSINELAIAKKWFPIGIIVCFTYVVPAVKFLLGISCLIQPFLLKHINNSRYKKFLKYLDAKNSENPVDNDLKKLYKNIYKMSFTESIAYIFSVKLKPLLIIRHISKYQLTDSFMAMFMYSLLAETYVSLVIGIAGYYFWGYCIASLIATQMISIFQLPCTKNMIFQPEVTVYEIDLFSNSHESTEVTKISAKTTTTSNQFKKIAKQSIFCLSTLFFMALIFIAFYIFYFYAYSLSVSINLLDYRLSIISSKINGKDLIRILYCSDYFINGFLTTLIFVFITPVVHIVLISIIFIRLLHLFFNDSNYRSEQASSLKFDSTSRESIKFGALPPNLVNFIKNKSRPSVNEFDLLIYKYLRQNPFLKTLIHIAEHIGDWSMMEVFCIATLSAYFTLNGMPNIDSSPPTRDILSIFYYMVTLGVSAFLISNIFALFANKALKLDEKMFDQYNDKYKLLPSVLTNNSEEMITIRDSNNESINENPNSSIFNFAVHEKKVKANITAFHPFFKYMWGCLTIMIAVIIGSTLPTFPYADPPQELSFLDFREILMSAPPQMNVILRALPFTIGNCKSDIELDPPTYKRFDLFGASSYAYTPRTDFLSGLKLDDTPSRRRDSCIPLTSLLILNSTESEPVMTPEPLIYMSQRVFIFTIEVYVYKLYGLSTAWIDYITLDSLPNSTIAINTRVIIPDFDIYFALAMNGIANINSTYHCCHETQILDLSFEMKCTEGDPDKYLHDFNFTHFSLKEFYLNSLLEVDPYYPNGEINLHQHNFASIINMLTPSFLGTINEFIKSFMEDNLGISIDTIISALVKMNSQPPYSCPVFNESQNNSNTMNNTSINSSTRTSASIPFKSNISMGFNTNNISDKEAAFIESPFFEQLISQYSEIYFQNNTKQKRSEELDSFLSYYTTL